MLTGAEVQRTAASARFRGTARWAFRFVREQTWTIGVLASLFRDRLRTGDIRANEDGWDRHWFGTPS